MTMQFTDRATLSGTRKTDDGFLVTEAFAVRTGIQVYAGSEVGLMDRDTVRVYRSEAEVRDPKSLATFSHAPITLGHPADMVTTDNWAELAKGEVSTEATWDNNKIKLPLIVKDGDAISAIEGGERELSAGYTCELEFVDGETPDGEAYDAIQKNIRVNHLAIVPKGRAGAECRIGDNANNWGASPVTLSAKEKPIMADALITVVLGDKAVSVTAADKATIDAFKADAANALTTANDAHQVIVDAKDTEIGTLKVDKKTLQDAAITPEKMTALIADRVALEKIVATIDADIVTANVSDADLRKAAVASKLGDEMVVDAADAEIAGMFKAIAKDAKTAAEADPLATVQKDNAPKVVSLDAAYDARDTALADAWKTPTAKGA